MKAYIQLIDTIPHTYILHIKRTTHDSHNGKYRVSYTSQKLTDKSKIPTRRSTDFFATFERVYMGHSCGNDVTECLLKSNCSLKKNVGNVSWLKPYVTCKQLNKKTYCIISYNVPKNPDKSYSWAFTALVCTIYQVWNFYLNIFFYTLFLYSELCKANIKFSCKRVMLFIYSFIY